MVNSFLARVRDIARIAPPATPTALVARPQALPEQTLRVLPARRAINSPIAKSLRERGFFVARGEVLGWVEQRGQSSIPLQLSVPDLERATATTGGNAVTINLDEDAARYLPPRTRIEIAVRILGEDEPDE